jgi:hypothetical protein
MSNLNVSQVYVLNDVEIALRIAARINNISHVSLRDLERSVDFVCLSCANNREVDNMEELAHRATFEPTELPYKIYILTDVAELKTEALLYLLTQGIPAAHDRVVFILCGLPEGRNIEIDISPVVY